MSILKEMTTEEKILAAAGTILEQSGPGAVTTRAVCAAAAVTAPTLYHHFGDMDGLVNALVGRGMEEFLAGKRTRRETEDPVADLRRGFDSFVDFALRRPALFHMLLERANRDPELGREAHLIMRRTLQRIADSGLLAVDLEMAALAVQAASVGTVSILAHGAGGNQVRAVGEMIFSGLLERLVVRAKA